MTTVRAPRLRRQEGSLTKRDLMDATEVAELLRVQPSTVKEWARQGELPSILLGRTRRFLRADVEAALMEKRSPGRTTDVVSLRPVRRAS